MTSMADEKDIAGDAAGGGKKRLIIIIAAGVLLLTLGAGAAAYFVLGGTEQAGVEGEAEGSEVAEIEEGDPVYLKLDPIFVVNLPPGGPAKMLQVAIQVMTYNPTVADTLQANDPMIRHHLLNLLERQQAADLMTLQGKENLQAAIHELLGGKLEELKVPGQIKGVFFTQFVMQ